MKSVLGIGALVVCVVGCWRDGARTEPPRPTAIVSPPPRSAIEPCATIDAERAEFVHQHENDHPEGLGAEDHASPPSCELIDLGSTAALDPPWADGVGVCIIADEIYGPTTCSLTFERPGERATISVELAMASARMKIDELRQDDVIAGGGPELVVNLSTPEGKALAVCRAGPLACTAIFNIGGDGWSTHEHFDRGELVLELVSGTPPADLVGRHPLVFRETP